MVKVSRSEDLGLSIFLVLITLGIFLLVPGGRLVAHGPWQMAFLSVFFLSATFTAVQQPKTRLLVIGLGSLAVSSLWVEVLMSTRAVSTARLASALLLLLVVTASLVRQTFRRGRITSHRIRGAVAVYLLLGLVWGFAYALVSLHVPGAFGNLQDGSSREGVELGDLVYFSFVTLTTVGYGDMAPGVPLIRSLAIIQALMGQLYLTITLARLVSLQLMDQQGDSATEAQ